MRRTFIFTLVLLAFVPFSCYVNQESTEQTVVKCSIFPLDSFTGEIGFYVMQDREFKFTSFFVHDTDAMAAKNTFDLNLGIPEKEDDISRRVTDYEKNDDLVFVAGFANKGFQLVCDKPFLGNAPGTDLSQLFYVYPLVELTYPDYSFSKAFYNSENAPTLYDFLSDGAIWVQSRDLYGLLFAPVKTPEIDVFAEDEEITFTLTLPLIGRISNGAEIEKTFEGSLSFFPNLPGESDTI